MRDYVYQLPSILLAIAARLVIVKSHLPIK